MSNLGQGGPGQRTDGSETMVDLGAGSEHDRALQGRRRLCEPEHRHRSWELFAVATADGDPLDAAHPRIRASRPA